ncbi:unnamed protein product [Lampetra fluviatilis]
MDTRKTHRTHDCDREENHDDTGQQASGVEEEETPAPQDPSWAPNVRLGADAGLRDAHSRLAELLLAAVSILAEITTSGGARTSTDIEGLALLIPAKLTLKFPPFLLSGHLLAGTASNTWRESTNPCRLRHQRALRAAISHPP